MNNANLKETHPQKYFFRIACNALFYLGFGSYWYEAEKTRFPRLYGIWCVVVNIYIAAVTIDKLLAYLRTDLTEKEKSDIIQVAFTDIPSILKIYVLILKRQRICDVVKKLLERNREVFTCSEWEVQDVKNPKILLYVFCIGGYAYAIVFTVQKIVFCYIEGMFFKYMARPFMRDLGVPIQTHVTYLPTNDHAGYFWVLCRVLIICHFWLLCTIILTVDCLCIIALISVSSKFKQTQMYFEMFRENPEILENIENFKKSVVNGIRLHEDALWCARNVQSSLGHIYGIHICLTIILLVINLLKFAVSERTALYLASNMIFFLLLIMCIGCYMINSGDITYEAAEVAPAVFHCGWERVRGMRGARSLLVVAIHRAQQPVYMTAFGFLVLSHENFISVLRSAYSFFAVVY